MAEKFRFLLLDTRPDTFPCANSTPFSLGRTVECPQPGFAFEMFQIYSSAMAVQPVISWIPNTFEAVGGYNETLGMWTGAFARVLNGSVDTLATTMSQTDIRNQYFDFSYPFYQTDLVYMVKTKEASAIATAFEALLSFSPLVWLLYLAAISVLTACLLVTNIVHDKSNSTSQQSNPNYNYMLWNFFRYVLDKSEGDLRQKSISGNIVLILSGIAAIIMLSLYESSLLAELLTRKETQPFHTVEEMAALIKKKEYKLVFDNPFHWYVEELKSDSSSNHYALMREALKYNPIAYTVDTSHSLDLLKKGGYILPTGTGSIRLFQAFEICEVNFISLSGTPKKYAQYMFRKNSTLYKRFNAAVISTARLTNRVWEVYHGSVAAEKREHMCPKSSNSLSPLSLQALIGLFAFLLAGAAVSLLLFLIEILLKYRLNSNKHNTSFNFLLR